MNDSNSFLFTVSDDNHGERLDRYLSFQFPEKTRSALQKLIEQGLVAVNQSPAAKNLRLSAGQQVSVTVPSAVETTVRAENIPLDIVYEDNHLLVVNKPKGMVVHPAPGNPNGTLVNALLYHCKGTLSGINGKIRPGIVHRIDKNTSGLLVVAKNDAAHQSLAEQIQAHTLLREYQAVVYGNLKDECGEIDLPIGRSKKDRKKMCVTTDNAREAQTCYEVLRRYQGFSHIRCRLKTGRTHQIRVHLAYLGHPVAGDDVYGPKRAITALQGQCLHAKTIGFVHPDTKLWMEFDCGLPVYFESFLRGLNN